MTGANHDYLVETVYFPDTVEAAEANGIDLDGDGRIDNKLGEIFEFITQNSNGIYINTELNADIARGSLIMLGRIRESGSFADVAAVQLLSGVLYHATPLFNGQDQMSIDPAADISLYLCGEWEAPRFDAAPAGLLMSVDLPVLGPLQLSISQARVRTVSDPDSEFFDDSSITPDGWSNVMVGGGVSRAEIDDKIIPFIVEFLNDLVSDTGDNDFLYFFDGDCVAMANVPGCEDVVAGEGACSDDEDPPLITATEVRCHAAIYWMFLPDIDSDGDGDGEADVLSFGYRVVSAVPVTIVE